VPVVDDHKRVETDTFDLPKIWAASVCERVLFTFASRSVLKEDITVLCRSLYKLTRPLCSKRLSRGRPSAESGARRLKVTENGTRPGIK